MNDENDKLTLSIPNKEDYYTFYNSSGSGFIVTVYLHKKMSNNDNYLIQIIDINQKKFVSFELKNTEDLNYFLNKSKRSQHGLQIKYLQSFFKTKPGMPILFVQKNAIEQDIIKQEKKLDSLLQIRDRLQEQINFINKEKEVEHMEIVKLKNKKILMIHKKRGKRRWGV